ncbi:MAG: helix-turn-helix domain-containing protein [Bacteroides sp.]|nr:helix-turn-helix domain-containing protein [[Eubacterium] siraeum]MCM1455863.1 helix-turn-helix domain-containing protein [Bacteroides sp.]
MEFKNRKNLLPQRLKQTRLERGLTQQQLADALNLNSVTYLRYEKGQRDPSLDMLIEFAEFFDVSTDYLLGVSDI